MSEAELKFVSSLVSSLAWPLVVFLIVCIIVWRFHKNLSDLIDRLESADTALGKYTFRVREALNEIKTAIGTREQPTRESTETEEAESEALFDPAAEILSAWDEVEGLGRQLLAKNNIHVPGPYRALGSRLKRYGMIDPQHADILDKLRQVRNMAAHRSEAIGSSEARDYAALSRRMIEYLGQQLEK